MKMRSLRRRVLGVALSGIVLGACTRTETPGSEQLARSREALTPDDTRTLSGQVKDAEGQWQEMMTVEYRRRR